MMRFASHPLSQQMDLGLQPASLLALKDEARYLWTHAIPPRKSVLSLDRNITVHGAFR